MIPVLKIAEYIYDVKYLEACFSLSHYETTLHINVCFDF